jgi:uncharacterized membrane protein
MCYNAKVFLYYRLFGASQMHPVDKQAEKMDAPGKNQHDLLSPVEKEARPWQRAEKAPGDDRLVMLCDGVFAIAMTLLVLNIRLPAGIPYTPGDGDAQFMGKLLDLLNSQALYFVITFAVIAGYWMQHRSLMQDIRRIDNRFIGVTFLFLLFIAFFPVTSSIIGEYGNHPGAVILYTLAIAGCGFSSLALWLYAAGHHRLIDRSMTGEEIISRGIHIGLSPAYFTLSLLLLFAPIQPSNIFWTWLLLPLFTPLIRRMRHGRLVRWAAGRPAAQQHER